MDDLTTILTLATKYGSSAVIVGFIYLIVKLTKYILDLIKKLNALEIQVNLNKERINQLERNGKDDL